MRAAKRSDRGKVKGVAEGVGHHDRLSTARFERSLELSDVGVAGDRIVIDENRNGAVLHDGRNRGGKTRRARDDFIAGSQTFIGRQLG